MLDGLATYLCKRHHDVCSQLTIQPPPEASRQTYPFALADLPYAYDALEPHIDQKTLQLHHRGHHATYVKKLNEAVAKHPDLHRLTLADLLRDLAKVPARSAPP